MLDDSINKPGTKDEITLIIEDGLQRDLSSKENVLISDWTQAFGKEEKATIINMLKELINKHKRHD